MTNAIREKFGREPTEAERAEMFELQTLHDEAEHRKSEEQRKRAFEEEQARVDKALEEYERRLADASLPKASE